MANPTGGIDVEKTTPFVSSKTRHKREHINGIKYRSKYISKSKTHWKITISANKKFSFLLLGLSQTYYDGQITFGAVWRKKACLVLSSL